MRLLMRTLLEEGEDPSDWRETVVLPFLDRAGDALGPAARLPLQSLLALGMRYVVASPRDLALMTGRIRAGDPDPTPEVAAAARADVEQHLVEVAQKLLRSP